MARMNVVMPQMGESITTGTITKWHKKPGDLVEIDEILLDISTDKVESEIPSPVKGRLEVLHFKEGDTVDVGIKIAEIEQDLSVNFSGSGPSAPSLTTSAPKATQVSSQSASPQEHKKENSDRFYTPLVKAMAQSHGLNLEELRNVKGHGAAGRVNKQDMLTYIESKSHVSHPAPTTMMSSPAPAPTKTSYQGRVEIIPMDNMRKAIAKNMVISKQTSPHVNSISEVDLTHLVKFRESFKEEFSKQEGFSLTYSPFIMKAIIGALKEFPRVNASLDQDQIILKKDIHLGFAVAVPGNGLMVPVIHQADTLNMLGLCRAMNDLANKARSKKLTLEHLEGGTFTFTNVGSFGTLMATPVILQPQLGIYASGVIQKRPVVIEGDALAIRSMMYGTHTYDHRLIDGELGGKFLEAIHKNLRTMNPKDLF